MTEVRESGTAVRPGGSVDPRPMRAGALPYALSGALAAAAAVAAAGTLLVPGVLTGAAVSQGNLRGTAVVVLSVTLPVLLVGMALTAGGSVRGLVVWLGAVASLTYQGVLFCFGTPLMPVDRHVERVSQRIGLIPPKATADQAHDLFLGLLEPEEMYAAHVLLIHHGRVICHAQNPKHDLCPVRDRCRFVDRKAP